MTTGTPTRANDGDDGPERGGTAAGAAGPPTLNELGDTSLVVAMARRREDALAEIYRRHGGVAFRLAQRVTGDERIAEDVCQEVFLQLWNQPESFDPDRGSLRSWLLMKTHSRSVDLIRSSAARYGRENRDLNDASRPTFDVDREVWDLVVADRITAALDQLPAAERDSVKLAYFGGLSYREVAVALGQPEGTVKSRIRSALRTLSSTLGDLRERAPGGEVDAPPTDSASPATPTQEGQSSSRPASNTMRPPDTGPGQPPGSFRVASAGPTQGRAEWRTGHGSASASPHQHVDQRPDRWSLSSASPRRDLSVRTLKGWLR